MRVQLWDKFALEFGKIAESDFVYTPAYLQMLTNQHQTWSKCMLP